MVAMDPDDVDTSHASWPKTLAPWLRALEGKVSVSLPATAGPLPTRGDLEQLRINVSIARIGNDRGLSCAILEAMELFNVLWEVDERLCWSCILQSCGRSVQQLSFPLSFLDGVRPSYVLCIVEEDVVDAFEQIMDVFDVFIMGMAEWNHSPIFQDTIKKIQLVSEQPASPPIAVLCHFAFEDDPVGVLPFRIESVVAVRSLAKFLQQYQEPAAGRTDDDSAFIVTGFAFDFGDGPLITHELAAMMSILFTIPVTALRFSAWNSAWMPPALVDDFCNNAFARTNYRNVRVPGIETLALHPTDLLDVDTFDICCAISESESLRSISFSDAWLGGVARGLLRRHWLEWILFAMFRDDSSTQRKCDTATFKLRYCNLSDIASICDDFNQRHSVRASAPLSGASTVYDTASDGEGQDHSEMSVEIRRYRDSVYDFTSIRDDFADCSSSDNSSSVDGDVSIVLPDPAPYRMMRHPVRHLTIELDYGTSDESTMAIVSALVWFVGEPLSRLTIIGSRSYGAASLFTVDQAEQVLTACPYLKRLELSYIEIESLSPFVDPSLCGQLNTLAMDRCTIQDKDSVENFYAALSDPTHPLYESLKALYMSEEDETSTDNAHFALKMLAKNDKLQQFVIHSYPDGIALKLLHRFRRFDGVPVAGESEAPMPMTCKLALLSIVPVVLRPKLSKYSLRYNILARIMEMAAAPMLRHCAVVST